MLTTHTLHCTGKVGKLEALRVSNEDTIESLQTQISNLEENVRLLEEEKRALETSQSATSECQLAQIRALEKVGH